MGDAEDMSHVTAMPIRREGPCYRPFSNRHSNLFDIIPFKIPYHSTFESPPQTLAKVIKRHEPSPPRKPSGSGSPQTPLKYINPQSLSSRPCHVRSPSPQTPVIPIKRRQLSTPRRCLTLASPPTPVIPAELCYPDTSRRHLLFNSGQKKFLDLPDSRHVRISETRSTSATPSEVAIQPAQLSCAGRPIRRWVPTSPPQTPLRHVKASPRFRPRPRKMSMDKLKPTQSENTSKSHTTAAASQLYDSPEAMRFINLTSDDSEEIVAAVSPSGGWKKRARRRL